MSHRPQTQYCLWTLLCEEDKQLALVSSLCAHAICPGAHDAMLREMIRQRSTLQTLCVCSDEP